jgi:prepilin-type N-terminal cleavage/methylation domain-containing protein
MFKMKLTKLHRTEVARNQSGFTLVEAVVSIALIGIIVAGLFTGLGTSSTVLLRTDTRETAKNLAETQLEFVKGQVFNPGSGLSVYPYAPIPAAQQGAYSASIDVKTGSDPLYFNPVRDDYIQRVIVTITGPKNIVYTLEGYKVR